MKIERLRTRIASDLHDDVASTLSNISLLCEMAKRENEAEMEKILNKIGDDAHNALNAMDDIVWSVNPQNDSLLSLAVRLREFALPICELKGIALSLDVGEIDHNVKLGMDERRNIYLIVKEAVINAVKHSKCTSLSVTFAVFRKYLEVKVIDDGCGFDTSLPTTRNGLVNMRRRASQTGGELTFYSEKGKSTTLTLKQKII